MTQSQTHPQSSRPVDDEFDATMLSLKSSLASAIGRDLDRPATAPAPSRAGPPAPRPVASTAPAGVAQWGPSSPRVTSPLALLMEVARDSYKLQEQVADLVERLTGLPPAFRAREPLKLPNALLPAVSTLATEIGSLHSQIATTLHQLKEDLS